MLKWNMESWGGSYCTILHPIIVLLISFMMVIIPYNTKLDHTLQLFKNFNTLPIRILFIYTTSKILTDKSGESKLYISVGCQGYCAQTKSYSFQEILFIYCFNVYCLL